MIDALKKDQLFFDHIPKAAGVSISRALSQLVGESFSPPNVVNKHAELIYRFKDSKLIACHTWFFPHENLSEIFFYCTVLRDPVDRFISQYYFSKQLANQLKVLGNLSDPTLKDSQVLGAKHLSLEDYLNSNIPELQNSYSNIQAIHFAHRKCANPRELNDDDLLESAISSLREYDLVGLFSDLNGFMGKICNYFEFPVVGIPHMNTTMGRKAISQISPAALEKLVRSNYVDVKLINWAKNYYSVDRSRQLKTRAKDLDLKPLRDAVNAGFISPQNKSDLKNEFGSKKISIDRAYLKNGNACKSGDRINLQIDFSSTVNEDNLTVGIAIYDSEHRMVYGTNSCQLNMSLKVIAGNSYKLTYLFDANLAVGEYSVTIALHTGISHEICCYHWMDNAFQFVIIGYGRNSFSGAFNLGAEVGMMINND